MGVLKQQKSKAYFKRYQVKFRRRREGRTDYRARKRLISQDKNKYNSPKHRFVVRFSNRDVVCQIIRAKIIGDEVLTASYAHELGRYGFPVKNNTSYAATYATGLLCARRLLHKLKLNEKYAGNTDVNGQDYNVEALADGPKPFYALLDVGLKRTTTGSKLFAALKGATDGGLDIPHSNTRFVGYDSEKKELNADILRKYIFGGNVSDYMKALKDENPERYAKQFSQFEKAGVKAEELESIWKKVHAAIRKDPVAVKNTKPKPAVVKRYGRKAMNHAQRKDRIRQRLEAKAKSATKA